MSKNQDATQLAPTAAMRAMIQRIATGPELSKDLSEAEARYGMSLILSGAANPVQSAIWLIALRMKRETAQENRGVLSAVRDATTRAACAAEEVVDIADPYNGYNRSLPSSPFLPAVLAACDVPAFSHGVRSMGPKYGITHHRVLAAAGVPVNLSARTAAAAVDTVGWAYVDQAQFCPSLYALADLRTQIVKRPLITTVEVLAGPITGARKTHLVTGYVHKPYPPIYAMLARHAGFDSSLLIRGVEGGVVPSLRQSGRMVRSMGAVVEEAVALEPASMGIESALRAPNLPDDLPVVTPPDGIGMSVDVDMAAQAAAQAGLAALAGAPGLAREALVYAASTVLWHLGRVATLAEAARRVRGALDGGEARARFEAARIVHGEVCG